MKISLRILRKLRRLRYHNDYIYEHGSVLPLDCHGQLANNLIKATLFRREPCMISRFGHTEMKAVLRYWHQSRQGFFMNAWRYLSGHQGAFWWDVEIKSAMRDLSGFFPSTDEALTLFAKAYLRDLEQVDILGTWLRDECEFTSCLSHAKVIPLQDLEPYYHSDPWTTALEGQTVLVMHPFEASIRKQYNRRELLFADPKILPNFTLKTLKTEQSLGGGCGAFESWFAALESMCDQTREIEFDVALIGAGAYGLPLAAFVKGLGKKAVHLGGATQILFGIKGKRWDEMPAIRQLYNEYWVRPLEEEKPLHFQKVENGTYW